MKYLHLNKEEFNELLKLKKGSFIAQSIIFTVILISTYILSSLSLSNNKSITPLSIVGILFTSNLIIFIFANRTYFHDLVKKEKRVYTGVLSNKKEKNDQKNRYQFNMDGNIFIVDKETFEKFDIGDIVEFHISSFTKHLFKVEKREDID